MLPGEVSADPVTVRVFHSPDCPYCVEALAFLERLQESCPDIEIVSHNVYQEQRFWQQYTRERNLPGGVYPLIVVGPRAFVGFLQGDGPLEADPTGTAYLGYSAQIARALREYGAECDLTSIVAPGEENAGSAESMGALGEAPVRAELPVHAAWLLLVIPIYAASYIPLRKRL